MTIKSFLLAVTETERQSMGAGRRKPPVAAFALLCLLFATHSTALRAQPECALSGPDSIHFDKAAWNAYLPGEFDVRVTITNPGVRRIDSVVAFARSSSQFTILPPPALLLAESMMPGDTLCAVFHLTVQPRRISGLDTIFVTISGKGGMRSDCMLALWVEKEYKPANELLCPPDSALALSFVDSLNSYVPDPLVFYLRLTNNGDAPSKNTRIMYVATPALSVADGQDPVIELGTLESGATAERLFRLRPVPRDEDTTVTVRFKAQGVGGLGDRIIDTVCDSRMTIPARRAARLEMECDNKIRMDFKDGAYTPNPFVWTATISNTGRGLARDVKATISLPPNFRLDAGESETRQPGDLRSGETTSVSWRVLALPVTEPDTGVICVRILDAFNNTALCCDKVPLPPITASDIRISCLLIPDSIGIDPITGLYQPAEATAQLNIANAGNEGADSVWAEIVVSDPDTELGGGGVPLLLAAERLEANGSVQAQWRLVPKPVAYDRDFTVLFRVRAVKSIERATVCRLRVAAALQPSLSCETASEPRDTLHFNPYTLEYDAISVSATVRNTGKAPAAGMHAAVLLPAGLGLADGESAIKRPAAGVLGPGEEWRVDWRLAPAKRRDGTLDTLRVEFKAGALATVCEDWIFIIGIPPITVLSMPVNNLGRHGRELRVPMYIDNTDNKLINRVEAAVAYDPALLEFLEFDLAGDMLERWSFIDRHAPGRAAFEAAGDTSVLGGEGTLAHMRFRILFGLGDDALKALITPLVFDTLASSINSGGVKVRFLNGAAVLSGDCLPPLNASDGFILLAVSPNPGSRGAKIRASLPAAAPLTLRVYDVLGRPVITLADGLFVNTSRDFFIPSGVLPPGLYFCRAEAAGGFATAKFGVR